MGDEISSDMPGTEEFAEMTEQELGEALPLQGQAPKDADGGGQQQADPAAQGGGATKKVEAAAAAGQLDPKPGDSAAETNAKIAALETTIQQLRRENRSTQALQSRLDRLENQLKTRETTASQTLSPEQQVQADQQHEAEKFLKKFLDDNIPGIMQDKYGNIIQEIEGQRFERNQNMFRNSVEQLTTSMGMDFKELDPILGKLLKEDAAAAKEGDQEADQRIQRILTNWDPHELILRAIAERSRNIQATGAKVQVQQAKAADKGGRAFKPNGAKPAQDGKRTLADVDAMSEEDREKLSMEELEALVPRQRPR